MNPIKLIAPAAAALVIASCAPQNENYDTSSPYGPADGYDSQAASQPSDPSPQTYDTPAAYEDAGTAGNTANIPAPPQYTPSPSPAPAPPPAASSGRIATTHTVVKGDTLGGIARKYKVSIASIKAANNMTSDIVVLGKALKIPAN